MPYYFMRDTPLQALEQLMMSQPGQKPRGGGIYRSPFHYTPKGYTAAVEIHLEVPVRFLGTLLPAAEMTLHTEAKYVPVF